MTHSLSGRYQPHSRTRYSRDTAAPEARSAEIGPDRNQRAETVNPIILTAQAPLQSVLSRVRTLATSTAGDSVLPANAREAELRILLAFVLLSAVVAAATVFVPTEVFRPRKDRVG